MPRHKILAMVPIVTVALFLINSWFLFLTDEHIPQWQHYVGLFLFLPVVWLLFKYKSPKWTVLPIGIYLVLGSIQLLSFNYYLSSFTFFIGGFPIIPGFNGLSFLFLIGYIILNFSSLVNMYLDHKERKKAV